MDNKITIEGKGGISASILADSINIDGDRLITYQLHYHRYIHSEFMTHRMFSRNASSSRAIPVKSVLENIRKNPAIPIHWGKNKSGMQADIENNESIIYNGENYTKEEWWNLALKEACFNSEKMSESGYHKQITNRIVEPFSFMNVICSATDYDNFFWLRIHKDAQPEIQELARCMYEAREKSVPELLREGQWHLPFISKDDNYSLEDSLKISVSGCCQVSYRKEDLTLEKANKIYSMLTSGDRIHASPFEHQATPFSEIEMISRKTSEMSLEKNGIKNSGVHYCGNLRGWTQLRKTLKDENHIMLAK